jgi:hypothetical protein
MGPKGERIFIVAVTLAIAAVLMGVLSDRLSREVVNAQQMRFEFRLREIEAVVRLREATLRARGALEEASQFDQANPMHWLESDELGMKTDLPDYLGEMPLEQAEQAQGKWVFDPQRKVLAHLPVTVDDVYSGSDWLQYQLVAKRSDKGAVTALALVPLSHAERR